MMVIADDEGGDTQLVSQHLPHELAGGEGCHRAVKGQDVDGIDARGAQQLHLLFGGGEQGRHAVWRKDSPWMAVKGDEQRACTTPPCLVLHLPDETLVTAVHAVEEADGSNSIHNS